MQQKLKEIVIVSCNVLQQNLKMIKIAVELS